MRRLALATIRGNARRMLSAGIAIMLGVAFIATTLLLSDSIRATLEQRIAGAVGGYAAVAAPVDEMDNAKLLPANVVERVRGASGVAGVDAVRSEFLTMQAGGGSALLVARTSASAPLVSGRLPSGPGEIALNDLAMSTRNLQVGSSILVTGAAPETPAAPAAVKVVGVVGPDPMDTTGASYPSGVAPIAAIEAWTGRAGYSELRVSGAGDLSATAVRDAVAPIVATAAGSTWQVQTGPERVGALVEDAGTQAKIIASMLLTFAAVALFVCALVIANTFTIVLAQRSRQLALMRCVGAGRGQVFAATVMEALLVGLVASVAGIALGFAVIAGFAATPTARTIGLETVTATPVAIVAPILVGLLVTVVASIVPAWRATRVAPLVALRPELTSVNSRIGWVRCVIGVLLVGPGVALLVLGAREGKVEIGIPGGVLSFVGVLVLGPVIVPQLVGLLRRPIGLVFGDPGRLAVDNARRNPARAAATSSALLVGVTLITMMLVGATTGRDVAIKEIDQRFPLDVAIATTDPGGVPTSTIAALRAVPGVAEVGALSRGGGPVLEAVDGKEAAIGVRFTPGADADATLDQVNRLGAQVPSAQIEGGASVRAELNKQIDLMLAIVVALLAVSIVIALVGVGNTLGLSVLERTRESALLRALGLTRGQLRGTLAIEALVLSGVGVVVGVILGVFYGWAGAAAILGSVVDSTPLIVPWERIGVAVAVALLAGVLASVTPARRAARIAPAQGLAAD